MKYYIINLFNNIKNLRFLLKNKVYSRLVYSVKNICIKITRKILYSFTMAKLLSAIVTCIIVAFCKYLYSGNLIMIDWSDFFCNFSLGLLSWTSSTCFKDLFSSYLDTKNFNLHQLLFGLNTHKMGNETNIDEFKPKLYNSMDNSENDPMDMDIVEDNQGEYLNKGKGVERKPYPNFDGDKCVQETSGSDNDNKSLDKGKGIDRRVHPNPDEYKPTEATPLMPQATEPPLSIWKKVYPGIDPADVFFPKRVNPGPGFNVPGGVVPIRDDICQHIDYNTHILNQFRKMDLETAIEQRNNNIKLVETLNHKLAFAQNALSKIPETPTTDYERRLKAKILSDLEGLNSTKVRSEARQTLLLSRIEFIQIEVNKKK